MQLNGKSIDYADWRADYSLLAGISAAGGIKNYFTSWFDFNEQVAEEGTPVVGYRIFYEDAQGNLHSPFFSNLRAEALMANYPGIDLIKEGITEEQVEKLKTDKKVTFTKEGVHKDPMNRGFYYFPDLAFAELYAKAYMARLAERRPIPEQTSEGKPMKIGRYGIFKVSGIAVTNTFGDEGFVMDEMQIDPNPVLELSANEPYNYKNNISNK